jgi:hypothetical protein
MNMVSKNYLPSKKAVLVPANEKLGTPAQIKVTPAALENLVLTTGEMSELQGALIGQSICPMQYFFADTPRNRELLKVDKA